MWMISRVGVQTLYAIEVRRKIVKRQNSNPLREVRLVRLANILQRGQPVSRGALEAELETSRATLTRDIATLRDQLNMPIAFDREYEGYVLAQKGTEIGPKYELPGLWISTNEAKAILALVNVTLGLDPGILRPSFAPLRSWIKRIAGLDYDAPPPISDKLHIDLRFPHDYDSDVFIDVSTALYDDKRVDIEVCSRLIKSVSPLSYILTNEGWLIDVFQETPEQVFRVPMERISSVKVLKQPARRPRQQSEAEGLFWTNSLGQFVPILYLGSART